MAMNNSSRTNQLLVPQSEESLDSLKYEIANELNVPLKKGYNGDLTSKQAGSVGGEMVKRMISEVQNQMSSR